jgi:hypothetical protein
MTMLSNIKTPAAARQLRVAKFAVPVLLLLQALLIARLAVRHAPTSDEVGHLPAGIYYWRHGTFDLYAVNPPLTRLIAAAPVVVQNPTIEFFGGPPLPVATRMEWSIGQRFIELNPEKWQQYFILARWALIPVVSMGGWIVYRWSQQLYGGTAGLFALTLWCFSPALLAWGASIGPDAAAASFGVLAGYYFWRWAMNPQLISALAAGLTLGLAQLTKTTWVILFALWPILWVVVGAFGSGRSVLLNRSNQAGQLVFVLTLGLYVLNLGYGFEGSLQRLGNYRFGSEALAGPPSTRFGGGNRFSESWLGSIPVPLPEHYVQGVDSQKIDFEIGKWAYVAGHWKYRGWWYYYLYAIAVKVPLGTWGLAILALALSSAGAVLRLRNEQVDEVAIAGQTPFIVSPRYWAGWRSELMLLAPAVIGFVLISSQLGINRHLRYVLPFCPFMIIWISKVAAAVELRHRKNACAAVMGLIATVTSSLWVYPHSMAYFNEFVGGPRYGHRHLLGSNLDWGQDVGLIGEWIDRNPAADPLYVECYTKLKPESFGLKWLTPAYYPQPGWHLISVSCLYDYDDRYAWLRYLKPVDHIGMTIEVFHVTEEDVRRINRQTITSVNDNSGPGGGAN